MGKQFKGDSYNFSDRLTRFEPHYEKIWRYSAQLLVDREYHRRINAILCPTFLMLTGALLLSKSDELSDFLKKRFSRIVYPLLSWSFIYILYDLILQWKNGNRPGISDAGVFIFENLKNGASFHLWYIYMLIGIYLFIPIIRKWITNASQREILYYLAIWILVIIFGMPFIKDLKPNIDLSYFAGYMGYPILGFFLAAQKIKKRVIPISLFAAGVIITIGGAYLGSLYTGKFYEGFYEYLSPNVVLASMGIFMLIKNTNFDGKLFRKLFDLISRHSYGIYLSHVLVLNILSHVGISWNVFHPVIGISLTVALCLPISLMITYAINRISLGKYVSG